MYLKLVLCTIQLNKLRFQKEFLKISFYFLEVNFSLLGKKILLKKVDFLLIFVHTNVQNFRHMLVLGKILSLGNFLVIF